MIIDQAIPLPTWPRLRVRPGAQRSHSSLTVARRDNLPEQFSIWTHDSVLFDPAIERGLGNANRRLVQSQSNLTGEPKTFSGGRVHDHPLGTHLP